MRPNDSQLVGANLDSTPLKKAWIYFYRSARLRCPVCGVSPLFRPVSQVKNINHWFDTLPGCPVCNYAYNREPGYFMLALWSLDYGLAALFGIALLLIFYHYFNLTTAQMLLAVVAPTFIFALLIARHAKAIYLAIDHYFFHNDGS